MKRMVESINSTRERNLSRARRDNERVYIARRLCGRFSGSTTTFQGVDVRWNIISISPELECSDETVLQSVQLEVISLSRCSPRTPLKRACCDATLLHLAYGHIVSVFFLLASSLILAKEKTIYQPWTISMRIHEE